MVTIDAALKRALEIIGVSILDTVEVSETPTHEIRQGRLYVSGNRVKSPRKFWRQLSSVIPNLDMIEKMLDNEITYDSYITSDIVGVYSDTAIATCMSGSKWEENNPNIIMEEIGAKVLVVKSDGIIKARCLVWGGKYYDFIYSRGIAFKRLIKEEISKLGLLPIPEDYTIRYNKSKFDELENKPYFDSFKGYHIDGEELVFKRNIEHKGCKVISMNVAHLHIDNEDAIWTEDMEVSERYEDSEIRIEGFNVGSDAPSVLRITENGASRMVSTCKLNSYIETKHIPIKLSTNNLCWINSILDCSYGYEDVDGGVITTDLYEVQEVEELYYGQDIMENE